MAEELGEKTEEPTPHRMNKARDEGQVAWSKDFASFVVLCSGTIALMLLAMFGTGLLKDWLAFGLNRATGGFDDGLRSFRDAGLGFAMVVFPVAGLVTLLAAAGGFLQVGFRPTTKSIGFKPEKLNPVKGFQRILGPEGFVRGALDSGKVLLLLLVAGAHLAWRQDAVRSVLQLEIKPGMVLAFQLLIETAGAMLLMLVLLAGVDFVWQRKQHRKKLRMTKKEVRDESKELQGDAQMKSRRQQFHRQLARQRIESEVPLADVVVTNPTHFSVALRYEPGRTDVPVVCAKGADDLAFRIRRLALEHDVPVLERPPLARALWREVAVGDSVPVTHFEAVAEVLAYVWKLQGRDLTGVRGAEAR